MRVSCPSLGTLARPVLHLTCAPAALFAAPVYLQKYRDVRAAAAWRLLAFPHVLTLRRSPPPFSHPRRCLNPERGAPPAPCAIARRASTP